MAALGELGETKVLALRALGYGRGRGQRSAVHEEAQDLEASRGPPLR
jgi:hypothetical protein